AVGADHAQAFARFDREAQVVDDGGVAVALGELVHLEQGLAHARHCALGLWRPPTIPPACRWPFVSNTCCPSWRSRALRGSSPAPAPAPSPPGSSAASSSATAST